MASLVTGAWNKLNSYLPEQRIETHLSDYIISAAKVHKLKDGPLWGIFFLAVPAGTTAGAFAGIVAAGLITKIIVGPQYYVFGMVSIGGAIGIYRGFSWGYNLAGRAFELINTNLDNQLKMRNSKA